MISKSCDARDRDWDTHLLYLLFAHTVTAQESSRELPFFLVYGRDPHVPTETVLSHQRSPYLVDVDDYKEDLCSDLSLAWKLGADNIQKARKYQRKYCDCKAKRVDLKDGDCVMVYMPSEVQGKDRKLKRPFDGPY